MNINRTGELKGAFNVTFEGAAFVPGVSFVTGVGTARSDSIVVLNRYEFWGMSEDPSNLWTYQARRLPGRLNHWTY